MGKWRVLPEFHNIVCVVSRRVIVGRLLFHLYKHLPTLFECKLSMKR